MHRRPAFALPLALALALALPALVAAAPATARAQTLAGGSPEGRWFIRGQDRDHGAVVGFVELTATRRPNRFQATRVVRREARTLHRTRGEAWVDANGRLVVETRRRRALTFWEVIGVDSAADAVERRHAVYTAAGPDALQGTVRDGIGGRVRGNEALGRNLPDNEVDLLIDGPAYYGALEQAIAQAADHVHFEVFSFFDDATGQRIADRLIAARGRGVEVRLIVDGLRDMPGDRLASRLRAGGVEIRRANPRGRSILNLFTYGVREAYHDIARDVGLRADTDPDLEEDSVFHRDHRKLVVVDGRVGFVGGMNVGDHYMTSWHDIHSRAEGPAVAELQRLFLERWMRHGGSAAAGGAYFPVRTAPAGTERVRVLETLPGVAHEIKDEYLRRIGGAQRRIWIESPYFTDPEVLDALKAAARRGVQVIVIHPALAVIDQPTGVGTLHESQLNSLLAAGIDVYAYTPRMCHGKVAIVDDDWATVGTANLDTYSLERNLEVNLFVDDVRFVDEMAVRVFQTDLAQSTRRTPRRPSFFQSLYWGLFELFRTQF